MNKIRKNFCSKNILFLTLLFVAVLVFVQAISFSFNLDYKAYNGAFQTFNPLRRIFIGEIPGRDSNPYLGLGTTYITAVLTYFFGGNFAASKSSIYLLSVLLHLLVLTTLFFLSALEIFLRCFSHRSIMAHRILTSVTIKFFVTFVGQITHFTNVQSL